MKRVSLITLVLLLVAFPAFALEVDLDSNGDMDIAFGGTNASTAAAARAALGLAIGTDVQAFDADLTAIAALSCTEDQVISRTAGGSWECADAGGAETNSLETTITGIADTEIFVGDGADSGAFVVVSGDATLANTGALTIASDVVEESMLKAVDTASDEECLTYESTTGDFEWQTCGAGGGISEISEDSSPVLGGNLDISTYNIEGVDATEFGYLDGVTSDIQTQFGTKAPIASPTFTGTVTAPLFVSSAADGSRRVEITPNTYGNSYSTWTSKTGWVSNDDTNDATVNPKLTWYQDGTSLAFDSLTLDASGFNGNLATTDDTLQEVAQALDDLTASMTYPGAGLPISTGSAWGTSITGTDNQILQFNGTTLEATSSVQGLIDDTAGDGDTDKLVSADYVVDAIADSDKTATASKSAAYTIGTDDSREAYGGVIYVSSAATITAPAVTAGMHFTVITIGAVAVSLDVNASDRMYLNGTALDDGDKATNTSTTGDIITCTYESAAGWYCAGSSPDGDAWTDGGA